MALLDYETPASRARLAHSKLGWCSLICPFLLVAYFFNAFDKSAVILLGLVVLGPTIAIGALVEAKSQNRQWAVPAISLAIWLAMTSFLAVIIFSD
jgi:hypothetical protein